MAKYALVKSGEILQFIDSDTHPGELAANKGTWYTVIDAGIPEHDATTHFVSGPTYGINMGDQEVTAIYAVLVKPPTELRAILQAQRIALYETKVEQGYPMPGTDPVLYVEINDGSRANLSGVAITALGCAMGALTWPEDYERGWVSKSGVRIPLPTPTDGLGLAYAAAAYYSALVQKSQDLEDELIACESSAELLEVDLETGW